MRLSGSLILCPSGLFLSKVVENLLQLLLLKRKTVKQRSLEGAVNPNVVLNMKILKDLHEDIIDTKPSVTRGTQHLLDTISIATTRMNIMMKSRYPRIDTANTVTITDQRTNCLTVQSIVMVRIVWQLTRKIKVAKMGLIMEFCSTNHITCLMSACLYLFAMNAHLIPQEVTIPMRNNTILK